VGTVSKFRDSYTEAGEFLVDVFAARRMVPFSLASGKPERSGSPRAPWQLADLANTAVVVSHLRNTACIVPSRSLLNLILMMLFVASKARIAATWQGFSFLFRKRIYPLRDFAIGHRRWPHLAHGPI
jgi:hypothetical protein